MSEFMRPSSDLAPNLEDLGDDVVNDNDTLIYSTDDYNYYSLEEPEDENFCDFDDVEGWLISGHGDIGSDCCGKQKNAYRSINAEQRHTIMSCKTQGCPKCFRLWAKRLSYSAASHLLGCADLNGRPLYHCSFSIPTSSFVSFEAMEKTLFMMLEIWGVKKRDVIMSIVRHPRRLQCETCCYDDGSNGRCRGCTFGKHQKKVWKFSPHLHLITDFDFTPERAEEFGKLCSDMDIVFKNITWETRNFIVSDEDMTAHEKLRRIIAYEFGHALYEPDHSRQVIRYFGNCSKTLYRCEKRGFDKEEVLDSRGDNFYQLHKESWDHVDDTSYRVRKLWFWAVRDDPQLLEWYPHGTRAQHYAIPLVKTVPKYEVVRTARKIDVHIKLKTKTKIRERTVRLLPRRDLKIIRSYDDLDGKRIWVDLETQIPDSGEVVVRRTLIKNPDFIPMSVMLKRRQYTLDGGVV